MNEELCKERHANIDKKLDNHEERIDKLEQTASSTANEIKNLCKKLDELTSSLKWLIALGISSLAGFFFYIIQNKLFK